MELEEWRDGQFTAVLLKYPQWRPERLLAIRHHVGRLLRDHADETSDQQMELAVQLVADLKRSFEKNDYCKQGPLSSRHFFFPQGKKKSTD